MEIQHVGSDPLIIRGNMQALSAGIGIVAAAALVLRFPPEEYGFYPRCPIYEYLHLQCPGCGATRAFAALLHGHLAAALHLNAFFVAVVVMLVIYATFAGYRSYTTKAARLPRPSAWATYALLALAVIFTVVRNIPFGFRHPETVRTRRSPGDLPGLRRSSTSIPETALDRNRDRDRLSSSGRRLAFASARLTDVNATFEEGAILNRNACSNHIARQ